MAPLFYLSNMLRQLLTVYRLPADWQVARAVVLLDFFSHQKTTAVCIPKTFKPAGDEPGRRAEGGKEN